MEPQKLSLKKRLSGLFLTAICPIVPIIYFIKLVIDLRNSNGTDDAVGWAFLFLIVIGIGCLPLLAVASVPFVLFLIFALQPKKSHLTPIPLILADLAVIIECFTICALNKYNVTLPYKMIGWVLMYVVLSVVLMVGIFKGRTK